MVEWLAHMEDTGSIPIQAWKPIFSSLFFFLFGDLLSKPVFLKWGSKEPLAFLEALQGFREIFVNAYY